MEQAYRILYLGALLLLGAGILFGLIRAIRARTTIALPEASVAEDAGNQML